MAAGLFSEASGVAHILEGQLFLLKPLVAVHGTQRLLTGCYQVLVLSLTYKHTSPPLAAVLRTAHLVVWCMLAAQDLFGVTCSSKCASLGLSSSCSCGLQVDILEMNPISKSRCCATRLAASQAMLQYRSGQPWQHMLDHTSIMRCQSRSRT